MTLRVLAFAALAGCAVPPLDVEGKLCTATDPCPPPFKCIALESGTSICTEGCPPESACNPTEGRACSASSPCPSTARCVRTGPGAGACTKACAANVAFEPFELDCADPADNDCDGRPQASRDVVLVNAPAEQPTWAVVADGGYAAVFVGEDARLEYQRFDPALNEVGVRAFVSEPTARAAEPQLVPLPGQTFGVTWLDTGAPDAGTLTRVLFAKVALTGQTLAGPVALAGAAAVKGRPRISHSPTVGTLLVLWVEGTSAYSASLLPDGTVLRARQAFPRSGGALTGLTSLDVTDRVDTNYDAGFAVGWIEAGDSQSPRFAFVDREADPLVRVPMGGNGTRTNLRTANTLLENFERSFFVWSESVAGTSTLAGRTSSGGAAHFTLNGSQAIATTYQDLELAISSDSTVLNYLDVAALAQDGSARVWVAKLSPGADAPGATARIATVAPAGRAPAIALGGGRHAFVYQADAGVGLQLRAQVHCSPP